MIMTKDKFNSTINMIISEFPSTKNWLKWQMENGCCPLIFCPMSDECISGFGKDTNGKEGIGGWIKRSYGLPKPTFTQAVLHLFQNSSGRLQCHYSGQRNTIRELKSPDERAKVTKKKRRMLTKYFVSDGQPSDTSKDLPLEHDYCMSIFHFVRIQQEFTFFDKYFCYGYKYFLDVNCSYGSLLD